MYVFYIPFLFFVIFICMEKYIQIKDFENYEISNLGNIRNTKTGRIIKQRLNLKRGYYQVNLHKNNESFTKKTHRLVAIAHIENPNNLEEVDHIDRNTLNNNASNLRWVSKKTNLENSMNDRKTGFIRFNKFDKTFSVYNPTTSSYSKHNDLNEAVILFQTLIEII